MRVVRLFVHALLLGAGAAAVAQPVAREDWYAMERGDVRYGYQRTVVEQLADGNFRYTIESLARINLFGVAPQESRSTIRCTVTPEYQVVTLDTNAHAAASEYTVRGRVMPDGRLEVRQEGAGAAPTRQLDLSASPIADVCLIDWLRQHAGDETRLDLPIVDTAQGTVGQWALTRSAAGAAWDFSQDGGIVRGTLQLDESGWVREYRFSVPKLLLVRRPADVARQIVELDMSGRDVLTFPIDADLPPSERLAKLAVKLTWRDIPLEDFRLDGWQQSATLQAEADGKHEVLVVLRSRELPERGIERPVRDPGMKRWLAQTELLQPEDEAIQAAAKRVVGEEKDALQAARKLSAFVFGHIEGQMIAETLSGPDVLERKVGKCTEYSTLFGSLARAAGIPTRLALGERLVGDNWMGHMWNEVYVGEWIPVDASVNEIGGGCSLLKFIHSDTVQGTQTLRWQLTKSLSLAVESFERKPSALAEKYETGVQGNVYTNIDYACRLHKPDDWTFESADEGGVTIMRLRVPGRDDVQVHFVAHAAPGATAEQVLRGRAGHFRNIYKGFQLDIDEAHRVGETPGHTIRFDREGGGNEAKTMRTTEYVWTHKKRMFLLNLIASQDAHDEYVEQVAGLLDRFELLSE